MSNVSEIGFPYGKEVINREPIKEGDSNNGSGLYGAVVTVSGVASGIKWKVHDGCGFKGQYWECLFLKRRGNNCQLLTLSGQTVYCGKHPDFNIDNIPMERK